MKLLEKLLLRKNPLPQKATGEFKTSGELIAEVTEGANLVEGKQTWEYAEEKKYDIEVMKKCCDSELLTMKNSGMVAAPYYFERVAILSRKEKNFKQEVECCEIYINEVESFYKKNGIKGYADVREGSRYAAILKRLPKAKELLSKQSA